MRNHKQILSDIKKSKWVILIKLIFTNKISLKKMKFKIGHSKIIKKMKK